MKISGDSKICALIGDPVSHSLSPVMHNAAFEHLGLGYIYVAFRVAEENLKDTLVGVRVFGIHGLNVTMPLKTPIIRLLDEFDSSAQRVGAVNTVLNKERRLVGYNTDGSGALSALRANGDDVIHKKIVILGAGGASRAVGHALAERAEEIVFLNRTVARAQAIAFELNQIFGEKCSYGELVQTVLRRELEEADIVINATPIGMHPHENESPINRESLRPSLTVFDLVYNPPKTRLLREADMIGAKTVDGLSMLVHQGAVSFEIWTGRKAPIDVMLDACTRAIRERVGVQSYG